MTLSDVEAAWLSGFIDGEGYVGLHSQNHASGKTNYQANIQINHCHYPTVEYVEELLKRLGIDTAPFPTYRSGNQSDAWLTSVTGMSKVLLLADAVEVYSVTKIQQWAVLREWCESRLSKTLGPYSERELELAAIGMTMNKRGRDNGRQQG